MFSMKKDKEIFVKEIKIKSGKKKIPALVLSPKNGAKNATGILWIHGGGYFLGMKEMVHMSRAVDLVKRYGAVVISPGYRLALTSPYPVALDDCYASLLYLEGYADELGVRSNQIMVGGESAGGGLCAAVRMMARDKGEVNVAFQMLLYPMLDNFDTDSSRNNHGKVWNTRRNHLGWKLYLRKSWKQEVSPYAAPARQTDYSNLPPAYTFVGDGEPFYCETLNYIDNLKKCGIPAKADVYPCNIHAFDMLKPKLDVSKQAIAKFLEEFAYAQELYFAEQKEKYNDD